GKFTLIWDTSGNPVFDDTEEHSVLNLLVSRRGQYWADPTGNRGSRMFLLKNLKRSTPSEAKAYSIEALQPLVDSGRIIPPRGAIQNRASAQKRGTFGFNTTINYATPAGQSITISRPPLNY